MATSRLTEGYRGHGVLTAPIVDWMRWMMLGREEGEETSTYTVIAISFLVTVYWQPPQVMGYIYYF